MSRLIKPAFFTVFTFLLISEAWAGPYPGATKNHGHTTAAGDGGALVNPSITGGNISPSTTTVNAVILKSPITATSFSTLTATGFDLLSGSTFTIKVGGISVGSITASGIWGATKNPAFHIQAYALDNINITGNSVSPIVNFLNGTELYDVGNNFASSSFTAPMNGIYHFSSQLYFTGLLDSAHTKLQAGITTTNQGYHCSNTIDSVAVISSSSTVSINCDTYLRTADRASLVVQVDGGSKDVDIIAPSFFTGHLVEPQ